MASENKESLTFVKKVSDHKSQTKANEISQSTPLVDNDKQCATDKDKDSLKQFSSLSSSVIADDETEPELIDRDIPRHEYEGEEDYGDEINETPTKSDHSSKFLQHSESLVISEIDSQYSPGLNDSRCTFDLLSSIQSATQEIKEKRERLKEEGVVDKRLLQGVYLEQKFSSSATETNNNNFNSNGASQSPFTDVNAPIMMVPGQHLLLPQQLKQLQQAQQISINYAHPAHGAESSSSLSSQIYTTATTTTAASTTTTAHIHNGNHTVMLQTHVPPGQSILHHSVGRRTMKLKLMEEVRTDGLQTEGSKKSIFSRVSVLARRTRSMGSNDDFELQDNKAVVMLNSSSPQKVKTMVVDRGEVKISWYDGTSTVELQDHVRKSVENKMRIGRKKLLLNLRVIDESTDPPEGMYVLLYL
jgi:hypothetical protein